MISLASPSESAREYYFIVAEHYFPIPAKFYIPSPEWHSSSGVFPVQTKTNNTELKLDQIHLFFSYATSFE